MSSTATPTPTTAAEEQQLIELRVKQAKHTYVAGALMAAGNFGLSPAQAKPVVEKLMNLHEKQASERIKRANDLDQIIADFRTLRNQAPAQA